MKPSFPIAAMIVLGAGLVAFGIWLDDRPLKALMVVLGFTGIVGALLLALRARRGPRARTRKPPPL